MIASRKGFTLVEVMVALVLTGMIALASYVALEAGTSTRERIEGPLAIGERTLLARTLLGDALRHAVDDGNSTEPFASAGGADGGDVLSFTTRGIVPPLGATGRWRVVVRGGVVDATPLDDPGPQLHVALPGVHALRLLTLQSGGWTEMLAPMTRMPADLRVEFRTTGTPVAPLVIHAAQGGFQ